MSLYRRPGSPFWWSKLYVAGSVVRFSTRERHKAAALRAEREEAGRLEGIAKRQREGRYSLATLSAKFVDWKDEQSKVKGRAPSSETRRMREKHLETALAHFGDVDARSIDTDALERFRADRFKKVGAATICKELSTVRQMLKYAHNVAKILPALPVIHNPEAQYTPAAWRILTREELGRLLLALGQGRGREVLPWALLRANTGMRPTETGKLEWGMVEYRAGGATLELPARITKGRRARSVPINEGALEALWMMAVRRGPGPAMGRIFHQEGHYAAWRVACEAAGLGRVRPHDLRHTLASYLHGDGVPLVVIRDILGHLTMDMVNRYAHAFDEQRAVALRGITVGVPAGVPLRGVSVPEKAPKGAESVPHIRKASATIK